GNGAATGSVAGNITNNANLTFNRADDLTWSGNISGSGSLTKLGTNVLTFGSTNSYTGATTISAGKLLLNKNLIGTSSVNVQSAAAMELAAGAGIVLKAGTATFAGTGNIDLQDNDAIFTNTTRANVESLVTAGRNGGDWLGSGITSTQAHNHADFGT